MQNLDKTYSPKQFEERIYQKWKTGVYFTAHVNPEKRPYTIVMPPPNVTGNLHLGHALNNTIQDILIRWKRLSGYEVLWVPGTDHASISTESKVVEKIRSEGKTKEELGREKFLEEAWEWTRLYGGNIKKQLEKLGVSCDWTRDSFTLDENLSRAVIHVFIKMYEEGLIYRGDRIVNWCPNCGTAVSDIEVVHEDLPGHLYEIRYPYADASGYVTVATTRPETMLGDLAVAVNPDDERYRSMSGKMLTLPLVGREIPLIEDDYVEMEFGTGAVKITPSHDPNDFEVGERHTLGQCVVIDEAGAIVEGYSRYSGMDRFEARKAVIEDLEKEGFLVSVKDHNHAVGHCERCHTVIEPLISKQWFVKMASLAKPAKEAYENGELHLIPDRFGKVYTNWLDNIKDWCISRQLWWGHRLPVYYCDDCEELIVSEAKPDCCPVCKSKNLRQDESTLDTWFSSALWPFSTLGWPQETPEMSYFYPTDVLVTGYDIIFFWVIRMVFSGLHHTGKLPFHHVYFTGLIRDSLGRKMSKSLNNGVDPLEVIEEYGADALRFTLVTGNSPGNDMRYYTERVEANRNFANKLWNASRFVLMNLEEGQEYPLSENLLPEDKWILSRLNDAAKEVDANLEKYEIGLAATKLYDFIWFEFCDWYIEFSKSRLYGEDLEQKETARSVLLHVLKETLILLHPFMPFITEEIYSILPNKNNMLIVETYPHYEKEEIYPDDVRSIRLVIEAVTAIRNVKSEWKIANSKKVKVTVSTEDEDIRGAFEANRHHFATLAGVEQIDLQRDMQEMENAVAMIKDGYKMFLPLAGVIDYEKERQRLVKEKENLDREIQRVKGKLNNEGFVSKAPEKIVEAEREKLERYEKMIAEVNGSLEELKKYES